MPRLDASGNLANAGQLSAALSARFGQTNKLQKSNTPDDIKQFTKTFSPWHRLKVAKELKLLPKNEKIEKLAAFYEEEGVRRDALLAEQPIRQVKGNAVLQNHLLVHTFPLSPSERSNTGMNNWMDTSKLGPEETVSRILSGVSSLSCSTVATQKAPPPSIPSCYIGDQCYNSYKLEKLIPTLYSFGLVIDEGEMLSAYRNDAGTLLEPLSKMRLPKYDREIKDKTSIQPNFEEALKHSLKELPQYHKYEGYTGMGMGNDLNELVVKSPKVSHLFINMDDPKLLDQTYERKRGRFSDAKLGQVKEFEKLCSSFPSLPVKVIYQGKTQEMSYDPKTQSVRAADASLTDLFMQNRRRDQSNYFEFEEGTNFQAAQLNMWATGGMDAKTEMEFLRENVYGREADKLDPSSYHIKDKAGKSAVHYAIESGKTRHIPEAVLAQCLDDMHPDTNPPISIRESIEKFKPAFGDTIKQEALLRGIDLTPTECIPLEIRGENYVACGKYPTGEYFVTSPAGRSLDTPVTTCMLPKDVDKYRALEQLADMDI